MSNRTRVILLAFCGVLLVLATLYLRWQFSLCYRYIPDFWYCLQYLY